MLEVQRDRTWYDIVTLDESWFYLSTDYELIMNSSGYYEMKKFPKENDTQFNRKFMLTIVWNPREFHLIKVLEKVASSTPAIISLRY
jgi:hypothetical protein